MRTEEEIRRALDIERRQKAIWLKKLDVQLDVRRVYRDEERIAYIQDTIESFERSINLLEWVLGEIDIAI